MWEIIFLSHSRRSQLVSISHHLQYNNKVLVAGRKEQNLARVWGKGKCKY